MRRREKKARDGCFPDPSAELGEGRYDPYHRYQLRRDMVALGSWEGGHLAGVPEACCGAAAADRQEEEGRGCDPGEPDRRAAAGSLGQGGDQSGSRTHATRNPRGVPGSGKWGDSGPARRESIPLRQDSAVSPDQQWPRRGSNPHTPFGIRDFKSRASASFATRPGFRS